MRNINKWIPTKFIKIKNIYKPNLAYVKPSSYYICITYIEFYVRYLQNHARGSLLDCGCGAVPYYEIYKSFVDEVTCTDWENTQHDNQFVDVFSDLNKKLNFADQSFDTVLMTDVLEHIYKPGQLLSEIHRVLKPKGKTIIAVPFIYRVHEEPHDYHRYTEYALRRMCEDHGLKIISLEAYGKYFDVLFDTINKVFIRNRVLLNIFIPFTIIIKKSFLNRKINMIHQDKYPLGYILVAEKM